MMFLLSRVAHPPVLLCMQTQKGSIKKGEKQHWNRKRKGVQAKFRVEGKEGFYKLRKAGDYVMLIPLEVGGRR